MLIFRDSYNSFNLDGVLFKAMTTCNFNVGRCNPQAQQLIYEFRKELNFTFKQIGRKSNRDHSLAKMLKPAAMKASGILTFIFTRKP